MNKCSWLTKLGEYVFIKILKPQLCVWWGSCGNCVMTSDDNGGGGTDSPWSKACCCSCNSFWEKERTDS